MRMLAGRYELIEKVGQGGMSVVWRALDTRLDRDVAVKLLHPFVAAEDGQRRRFAREARTLAALSSDHIVRLHDYVEDGDDAFLVMEFVDGRNLAAATFHRLPVPWSEAAAYARSVCEALAYAHAKGVVHRDLTPGNVLVERETGRVVTSDFGLARIARGGGSATTIGVLLGTPEYWSPEQAVGRESDAATDMYALGCILFLLLSGRLPFEGDDRLAVGLRRAHEDAPSLRTHARDVPESAVSLVDALLSRDPSRRPDAHAAASALAHADEPMLARATVALPVRAEKPTLALAAPTVRLAAHRTKRKRRWPIPAFGALAGVLAGVFVAAHLLDHGLRAPDVVRLREADARARILGTVPTANVSVVRVYSANVARGRVVRQLPAAKSHLGNGARFVLTVSKGTPFAELPTFVAGTTPEHARAYLETEGFAVRYRWTPSWTVHKGAVIGTSPSSGTRVRRPATVRVVVSSGWPRSVVPDVQNTDLASAKQQLEAKHLRVGIVYRPAGTYAPNQVVTQQPQPGRTVYNGTRVWLAVARTQRWKQVFAQAGSGEFESVPVSVPGKWRIRYRLDGGNFFGDASTEFSWSRDGDLFGDGSFVSDTAGSLQVHGVSDGAGTYRISVRPDSLDTSWYVEVDSLQ
jgi:predicted Ser/Thr protein kinase